MFHTTAESTYIHKVTPGKVFFKGQMK